MTSGLPSEIVQEHRKSEFSTVRRAGTFVFGSPRRAFDDLTFLTSISQCAFDKLTFAIRDFLVFLDRIFPLIARQATKWKEVDKSSPSAHVDGWVVGSWRLAVGRLAVGVLVQNGCF